MPVTKLSDKVIFSEAEESTDKKRVDLLLQDLDELIHLGFCAMVHDRRSLGRLMGTEAGAANWEFKWHADVREKYAALAQVVIIRLRMMPRGMMCVGAEGSSLRSDMVEEAKQALEDWREKWSAAPGTLASAEEVNATKTADTALCQLLKTTKTAATLLCEEHARRRLNFAWCYKKSLPDSNLVKLPVELMVLIGDQIR